MIVMAQKLYANYMGNDENKASDAKDNMLYFDRRDSKYHLAMDMHCTCESEKKAYEYFYKAVKQAAEDGVFGEYDIVRDIMVKPKKFNPENNREFEFGKIDDMNFADMMGYYGAMENDANGYYMWLNVNYSHMLQLELADRVNVIMSVDFETPTKDKDVVFLQDMKRELQEYFQRDSRGYYPVGDNKMVKSIKKALFRGVNPKTLERVIFGFYDMSFGRSDWDKMKREAKQERKTDIEQDYVAKAAKKALMRGEKPSTVKDLITKYAPQVVWDSAPQLSGDGSKKRNTDYADYVMQGLKNDREFQKKLSRVGRKQIVMAQKLYDDFKGSDEEMSDAKNNVLYIDQRSKDYLSIDMNSTCRSEKAAYENFYKAVEQAFKDGKFGDYNIVDDLLIKPNEFDSKTNNPFYLNENTKQMDDVGYCGTMESNEDSHYIWFNVTNERMLNYNVDRRKDAIMAVDLDAKTKDPDMAFLQDMKRGLQQEYETGVEQDYSIDAAKNALLRGLKPQTVENLLTKYAPQAAKDGSKGRSTNYADYVMQELIKNDREFQKRLRFQKLSR